MAAIVEPEVATYQQYIDGEWAGAEDGRTYPVINPSNEEVMAAAPASTRADARRPSPPRAGHSTEASGASSPVAADQIMFQIAEHLQEVSEDWGLLESQNAGAALRKTSVVDVPSPSSVPEHGRAGARVPGTSRCPGSIRPTCHGTSCSASRSASAPGIIPGTTH